MIRMGRHIVIPDLMQIRTYAPKTAAVSWWLSGGVSGANCLAAYQPKGAASLAASYVNLHNPGTYDAVPGVAPTFNAATGWTFNGTNQWLRSSGLRVGSTGSVIIRASGVTAGGYLGSVVIGGAEARELAITRLTAAIWRYENGAATYDQNNGATGGVFAIARNSAFYNGTLLNTISGWADQGTSARDYAIGALWPGYGPYDFLSGSIQAIAIYNAALTADQVAAITTAMQAL